MQLGDQDLRFTVDQIGVPVLVKISYFPNWKVSGAEGPYRIAPNLMVVVPTSTDVHLTYERSTLDYLAYLLTLIGIGMLIYMRIRGDVRHANTHPFGAGSEGFEWDEWDAGSDEAMMIVDPTPSQPWHADVDDPLETDLSAESLVWASPPVTHDSPDVSERPASSEPSDDSVPPDANL